MTMTTAALNALSRAASAYLRSAMHQPVQWHEWGEEAFAEARRENKPMLARHRRGLVSLVPRHGPRILRRSRHRGNRE